jgi:hypothetical protein
VIIYSFQADAALSQNFFEISGTLIIVSPLDA